MAFCKFCGKEIPEGAQCDCAESQAAAPDNVTGNVSSEAVPAAEAAPGKPSNKAAIVIVAALVVILIIIFTIVSSIAGGGYKKPVNEFEKALNKTDGERLAECMLPDEILEELDDDDFDDLSDAIEWLVDLCEDEYGKNVKFSISIDDKEKLRKSELKEIEEDYNDEFDSDIEITKGYEIEGVLKIKGKDDKEEEDITLTVVKIKGDGWKLSYDSFYGMI